MFTTLSKTVGIVIMCSTVSLFAQEDPIAVIPSFDDYETPVTQVPSGYMLVPAAPQVAPAQVQAIPNTDNQKFYQDMNQQVQVSERPAVEPPVEKKENIVEPQAGEPSKKNRLRTNKTIQSMNFYLPIESETWKIKPQRYDWSSIGYQFSWTRYKTEENSYSSVFGLGIGFLVGDLNNEYFREKIDLKGLDFNVKVGLGMAPISNDFIVAFHFICGLDLKVVEGDIAVQMNNSFSKKYTHGAAYADTFIGGDLILGYHIFDSLGVIAGVDITTNAFGIGVYYTETENDSNAHKMNYLFSGVNITPHIGLFFVF